MVEQWCSSVTFPRDDSVALGTCATSGDVCTEDSQCTGTYDFCVMGACEDDPSVLCANDDQCGGACLDDLTFTFDDEVRCGQFANGDWWVAADGAAAPR